MSTDVATSPGAGPQNLSEYPTRDEVQAPAALLSGLEPALPPAPSPLGQAITALIIFGPIVGIVLGTAALIRTGGVSILDLVLLVVFYALSGHGLTAGYHRMLTHRAFKGARWVKITLVLCGSFGFEGSVNGWIANHRRHHAFTDRVGDPHSPYAYDERPMGLVVGAIHAHVGWLFQGQATDEQRWAPDCLADRDLVVISNLFPLWCVLSLALPTFIAWCFTGTLSGAVGGLVWGGLIRMFLLHHSTFAVNSVCHIWGKRPFTTTASDRSTNFAPLFLLSMGENWHNLHHSAPTLARFGVDRWQVDSTGRLIWLLERTGAVWDVRWPEARRLAQRRRGLSPVASESPVGVPAG
jgi:stearoyl-CoA desaturase (delta-9 desaturase)